MALQRNHLQCTVEQLAQLDRPLVGVAGKRRGGATKYDALAFLLIANLLSSLVAYLFKVK